VVALAYQSIGYAGAAITFETPGALGDTVQPNAQGFLWVKNGGGVSTTVAIVVPGTTQGQANPDVSISISAGAERMIGPLVDQLYDSSVGGILTSCTPQASVSVAAVTCERPFL
jgi:hypothetical protein